MEQKLEQNPLTAFWEWMDSLPTERKTEVFNALQEIDKCLAKIEERLTRSIERTEALEAQLEGALAQTDKKVEVLKEASQVAASLILNPTTTKKPS